MSLTATKSMSRFAERRAHDVAADASEAVDADFHCHRSPPNGAVIRPLTPSCGAAAQSRVGQARKMPNAQTRYSNDWLAKGQTSGLRSAWQEPGRDAHVPPLQPAHSLLWRPGVAVPPVSGDSLQEVRRQPRPAARLPAGVLQPGRRGVDLDSRRLGRRGADRAGADCRAAAALSEPAALPVDDDDGRPAGGAAERPRRRRRLLLSVRPGVHRPADAGRSSGRGCSS